jgi:glycosyltransferase involved in cell wall biosynthesis
MYITTLTREMSRQAPDLDFVIFDSAGLPLHELDGLPHVRRMSLRAVPRHRAARILYQNWVYPMVLARQGLDVLLATCNVLPIMWHIPAVLVIQSLQYFDQPGTYGRWRGKYLRLAVRGAVRRASQVICVSHNSRQAALHYTRADPAKFHVVYHGVPDAATGYGGQLRRSTRHPYILTVTTLYKYKNVERLIEAYAQLVRDHRISQRLRILGGNADLTADTLRALAARLGVAHRVDVMGAIAHDRLPAHYAAADLFVYPSLYETFGLPPLEAMALNVPVVASNATAIPEVVGGAAELVDPLDVSDMARGMAVALLDPRRREELRERGRARAAEFSWSTSARTTLQVLRTATGGRSL